MKEKTFTVVGLVLIINILSRACALIAGVMVTSFYGTTLETSAYSFALNVTNIITTVIGTALTTSVIPTYTELKEHDGDKNADKFVGNIVGITVLLGAVLAAAGMAIAPIMAGMAEGGTDFAAFAIRGMMPAIIFISLYYIFSGVLQSNGKFYLAAMVSIPSSLVNILYIILLSPYFGVAGLVYSTVIGFFLQAFILYIPLIKSGRKIIPAVNFRDKQIKTVLKLSAPVLIGVCAHQINLLTNSSIAYSYNGEKYIVLSNIQNLGIQIVMTIILAVASVMYPKLTHLAVQKDNDGFNKMFTRALNLISILMIPISVGFVLLSENLIDLVYGYGKFSAADVKSGAVIFSLYALGVLGNGFKEIVDRAYYARKITKPSAYNGVLIMAVNIVLSAVLVKFYGFNGIAVAYSIASLCGGFTIFAVFARRFRDFKTKPVFINILKCILSALLMGCVVWGINTFEVSGKLTLLIKTGMAIVGGMISYAVFLLVFKCEDLMDVIKSLTKREEKKEC